MWCLLPVMDECFPYMSVEAVERAIGNGNWSYWVAAPDPFSQWVAQMSAAAENAQSMRAMVHSATAGWLCLSCGRLYNSVESAWRCCPPGEQWSCSDCGEPFAHEQDAEECCYSDEDDSDAVVFHDYNFVPRDVLFRGDEDRYVERPRPCAYPAPPTTELYLGLEVECEAIHCDASEIVELWDSAGMGWCTSDGSLSDSGVECCSWPTTYARLAEGRLASTLDAMMESGARAWRPGTCGLHIHVSAASFKSQAHRWRFAYAHTALAATLRTLAGRSGCTWCKWPDEVDDVGCSATKILARKEDSSDRYVAVNVPHANAKTIELRFWRGNLRPHHVLGAVALADAMQRWTRDMTFLQVRTELTWEAFTAWIFDNLPDGQCAHIATLARIRGVPVGDVVIKTTAMEAMAETEV